MTTYMKESLFQLFDKASRLNKVQRKDFKSDKDHIRARNKASESRRMASTLMNAMAFGAVSDSGDVLGIDAWAKMVFLPEHEEFDAVPESQRNMDWLAQRLALHLRKLHTLSLGGTKSRVRAEPTPVHGPVAPVFAFDPATPRLLPAQPPEADANMFMALPRPSDIGPAVSMAELNARLATAQSRYARLNSLIDNGEYGDGEYGDDDEADNLVNERDALAGTIIELKEQIAGGERQTVAEIPFCLSPAELELDEHGQVDA